MEQFHGSLQWMKPMNAKAWITWTYRDMAEAELSIKRKCPPKDPSEAFAPYAGHQQHVDCLFSIPKHHKSIVSWIVTRSSKAKPYLVW